MSKLTVAVYKLSSCAGCQLQILNLEPVLPELLDTCELARFPMARRAITDGPYDLGLVEGAVTGEADRTSLIRARAECDTLVAMGACACSGGIPALRRAPDCPVVGIDRVVSVDARLRGCPIDRSELVELLTCLRAGTLPPVREHSVCMDCRQAGTDCLLLGGIACMGPVTAGGCGAVCPVHNRGCAGCRGPAGDVNLPGLRRAVRAKGGDRHDLQRKIGRYCTFTTVEGGDVSWRTAGAG